EIGLVKADLRRIVRKSFLQAVALDGAPVLGVGAFMLPDQRIDDVRARQAWTVVNDPVGMAAQRTVDSAEGTRLVRCELEAGRHKKPAHTRLEIVSAIEYLARSGRELGLTPPRILHLTRTVVPDQTRAQVRARQLRRRCRRALDSGVDGGVDRLEG